MEVNKDSAMSSPFVDPPPLPLSKRGKKLKRSPEVHEVHRALIRSSKQKDLDSAMAAFRQYIAIGRRPTHEYYSLLLNLCVRAPVPWENAKEILSEMSIDNVEPMESGYTALVKMHLADNDMASAFTILEKMVSNPSTFPKRRTLLPVLERAAMTSDMDKVTKVMGMYKVAAIVLKEEEFAALVCVCTVHGDRKKMAEILEDMRQLLYSGVSRELMSNLNAWFAIDCRVGSEVIIGPSGVCPACKTRLRAIDLDEQELTVLRHQMEEVICHQLDGLEGAHGLGENIFVEGTHQSLRGANYINHLKKFLALRGGFDIVVDGANVGYYMQKQWKNGRRVPKLKFSQIDRVVRQLQPLGRVLLVIHEHHVRNKNLSKMEAEMAQAWIREKLVYLTPYGMNDDWFWLLAGLTGTADGHRSCVVTNDHMLDHHQMLSQVAFKGPSYNRFYKQFLMWRERHWATFTFLDSSHWTPAIFTFPPKYSLCIQSHETKRAGPVGLLDPFTEQSKLDHTWHFPITYKGIEEEGTLEVPLQQHGSQRQAALAHKIEYLAQREWLCIPSTSLQKQLMQVPTTLSSNHVHMHADPRTTRRMHVHASERARAHDARAPLQHTSSAHLRPLIDSKELVQRIRMGSSSRVFDTRGTLACVLVVACAGAGRRRPFFDRTFAHMRLGNLWYTR